MFRYVILAYSIYQMSHYRFQGEQANDTREDIFRSCSIVSCVARNIYFQAEQLIRFFFVLVLCCYEERMRGARIILVTNLCQRPLTIRFVMKLSNRL